MKLSAMFVAAVVGAGVALVPGQAASQDGGRWMKRLVGYSSDGQPRYVRAYCYRDGRCYRSRRYTQHSQPHRATRVYSYVKRDTEDHRQRDSCRDVRRAVGDQHLTLEGAKKAANDAWAGTIRFHLGEKFMDLANAKHIVYTCSRSSIKEGGVTTLGQTLTRCEVEAQPCHPSRETEASNNR